jgi:hypothetical protein
VKHSHLPSDRARSGHAWPSSLLTLKGQPISALEDREVVRGSHRRLGLMFYLSRVLISFGAFSPSGGTGTELAESATTCNQHRNRPAETFCAPTEEVGDRYFAWWALLSSYSVFAVPMARPNGLDGTGSGTLLTR